MTKTPGQVAYETFRTYMGDPVAGTWSAGYSWHRLQDREQQAWEAAAALAAGTRSYRVAFDRIVTPRFAPGVQPGLSADAMRQLFNGPSDVPAIFAGVVKLAREVAEELDREPK